MKEFFCWLFCFVFAGIGIFRIVKPEESIYMREHWRFKDYEPSEAYIKMERFSGIVCLIVAVILIISTL